MISENLPVLKIHILTPDQYKRELNAGTLDEGAWYLTYDDTDKTLSIAGIAADAEAVGNALSKKAEKPLIISADSAPTTGNSSVSGIPIFTLDYTPSDLKAHAEKGGSVTVVRYGRAYEMYDATDSAAKFRFIEVTDSKIDSYHAVLDTNRAVTITKTTHRATMENTSGAQIGQIPCIKGLNNKGLPSSWIFIDPTAINFKTDNTLVVSEEGVLGVNVAGVVEKDNTLPVSSAAVYTTVGNISALLDTI